VSAAKRSPRGTRGVLLAVHTLRATPAWDRYRMMPATSPGHVLYIQASYVLDGKSRADLVSNERLPAGAHRVYDAAMAWARVVEHVDEDSFSDEERALRNVCRRGR
jgi:hypothetical protein